MNKNHKPGYHIRPIAKGTLGEISKILEEVTELQDAKDQGVKIMELVELSDIYGALELYLKKNHPDITMQDLAQMSAITQRAFKNGKR